KATANIDEVKPDSTLDLQMVYLQAAEQKNIYIDTCYFSSPVMQPGTSNELTVKIKNSGNAEVENIPVKLLVNDVQTALSSVTMPANGSVETKLMFTISKT